MLVISPLWKQRQKNLEFKASLSYIGSPYLKKQMKKEKARNKMALYLIILKMFRNVYRI
jgi:hypothetical protein